MNKKVTIYDIAKELNITAATVSRALNDNPKISESTKKLVAETAARMNYKQNKLAVALKSGKSNNVGVIVPYIDRNFFSSIIRGIEEELDPEGYHTIICQTHESEKKEKETINALLNTQIDGIMVSISKLTEDTEHFKNVLKKNVPLIFFDRKMNLDGVSTVTINDFDGGYQSTRHLIEQGCKRIAHFHGNLKLEIYNDRFEGYKQALKDCGYSIDEQYVMQTKSDIEAGRKAIAKMMSLPVPPDAVFCSSDYVALGAIQYLKEMGVRIPDDFCVVGFSNEPFTKFMELSISSVDQTPMQMGKMAARVFLEQVKNSDVKIEKKVVLAPELQIRKSSQKRS